MLTLRVDVPPIAMVRHSHSSEPATDYSEAPSCMPDLIRRLTLAPARLEAAIAGLSLAECERRPLPDEPSVHECVEHVAVYALGWSEMFYRAIASAYPTQRSHNSHWKERLTAEARTGLRPALGVFRKHNKSIAEFLSALPQTDFDRPFTSAGPSGEPFWINVGINWGLVMHCDHELATIHKLRIALGKPLDWMAVYLERYPPAD